MIEESGSRISKNIRIRNTGIFKRTVTQDLKLSFTDIGFHNFTDVVLNFCEYRYYNREQVLEQGTANRLGGRSWGKSQNREQVTKQTPDHGIQQRSYSQDREQVTKQGTKITTQNTDNKKGTDKDQRIRNRSQNTAKKNVKSLYKDWNRS